MTKSSCLCRRVKIYRHAREITRFLGFTNGLTNWSVFKPTYGKNWLHFRVSFLSNKSTTSVTITVLVSLNKWTIYACLQIMCLRGSLATLPISLLEIFCGNVPLLVQLASMFKWKVCEVSKKSTFLSGYIHFEVFLV